MYCTIVVFSHSLLTKGRIFVTYIKRKIKNKSFNDGHFPFHKFDLFFFLRKCLLTMIIFFFCPSTHFQILTKNLKFFLITILNRENKNKELWIFERNKKQKLNQPDNIFVLVFYILLLFVFFPLKIDYSLRMI